MSATTNERTARRRALEALLTTQPRIALGTFPTPLEPLPNLTRALGGPSIYVKRDDMTGLAFGGNKTRSLEYVLGTLMEEEPEVLVTGANIQSNWCRQAAAAAAKLSIPLVLVLRNSDMREIQGNALLDFVLGADVRFVDEPDMTVVMLEHIDAAVAELRSQGRRAVKIDPWSNSVALGYVQLIAELDRQCEELGIQPTRLWASAAGPTQAGALLGARMLGWPLRVTGVAPIEWTNRSMEELTADCANVAAELLGSDIRVTPAEVESLHGYMGPGYGLPSPEGLDALLRVARSDGLLLDPVYTSKAMAALIEHISTGQVAASETVVFVHTGGVPALFAHRDAITRHMGVDDEAPIAR
jgi:1-aminocyclopropane-1-carboxylate deaminase/D-cysteine desulfhydrase-like pyridoxal-dependent ACC family enzyme